MTYGKVLHTEQHGERIVNVRFNSEYNEYRCRLYTYGKAQPDAEKRALRYRAQQEIAEAKRVQAQTGCTWPEALRIAHNQPKGK